MLRKEDRALFVALLLIPFALLVCWVIPSPYTKPGDGSQKCATHECREDASAQALVVYTKELAIFTGLLFAVSAIQGFFVYRADRTARISANAARDSARALTATERAHIFLTVAKHHIEVRPVNTQYTTAPAAPLSVRINVTNYGKTPAVLREMQIGFKRLEQELPDDAWAEIPRFDFRKDVLGAGESLSEKDWWMTDPDKNMNPVVGDLLQAGGLSIYFFGHVTYEDVFGEDRELQFCWRWHRGSFRQWGGRKHNYRT